MQINAEIDSILKTIDSISSPYQKAKLLSGFSGKYNYQENTYPLISKIKLIGHNTSNKTIKAIAKYTVANFLLFNGKSDSAYIQIQKANSLISEKDDPILKSSILTTLGGYYKQKGNVTKAIATLLEAKHILDNVSPKQLSKDEAFKLKGKKLVLHNTLANFYNQMEDYSAAIKYYDLAFKSTQELGSQMYGAIVLSNKGDLLSNTGNYQEALEVLRQAKDLKLKSNAPKRSLAITEVTIGTAYRKLGMLNNALKSYNRAYNLFNEVNNTSGIANTLFERGKLYNQLGKYPLAKKDCEKAKKLALELGDLDFQKNACQCLFNAYKELDDYKNSLANYELFVAAKDSVFNEKNIKKITQLQMQYDFDKQQTAQKLKTQKTEQQRKLFLIFAVSGFIIIGLLSFFFIKNRNKNIQISKALNDKEILLKEIHHRVKNNLQVVSSLLSLQQMQTKDQAANQALEEGRNRVKAMALIHQNLYQDENLVGVNTKQYIERLVANLVNTYKTNNKKITVKTDIEPVKLDVDTITPLGLIINELISNALKYAFKESDSGTITISLKKEKDTLTVSVSDNGIGLPKNFSYQNSESLGYKLIHSFSQKLQAKLNVSSSNQGTKITLKINNFKTV